MRCFRLSLVLILALAAWPALAQVPAAGGPASVIAPSTTPSRVDLGPGTRPNMRSNDQAGGWRRSDYPPDVFVDWRRQWPSSGITEFEDKELLSLEGIDPRLQPVCLQWTNKCIECLRQFEKSEPSPARCRVSGWLDIGETVCKPVETVCLFLQPQLAFDRVCLSWSGGNTSCGNPYERLCRIRITGRPPWTKAVKCNFR